MRNIFLGITLLMLCSACHNTKSISDLSGTYKLIESITIKGNDTVIVKMDPQKSEMIKMFNSNRFAFFNHDLKKGVDSTALFVGGSGTYTLDGNQYVEHLIFCSFRPWEGKEFTFHLQQKGDTLLQEGVEEIPELGVKQYIIEKYIKIDRTGHN